MLSSRLVKLCSHLTIDDSSVHLCLFLDFREQAMCSVGFCVINSLKRCYPLEDATHIALRKSVRK